MTTQTPQTPKGHETSDVPLKGIVWCVAGLIGTALLIHLGLNGYVRLLGAGHKTFGRVYQLQARELPRYPAPALQANPAVDLQVYRTQADRDLNGTGWIDQAHGVVKISIDRAMALLAVRGLPVRPAVQNGPTELEMQQQKAVVDRANAAEQPAEGRRQ